MRNIWVTHTSRHPARSESAIIINPNDPRLMVAASKRFRDIHTYDFTLASFYSWNGGLSWHESADFVLPAGATLMTDPTVAWDDAGSVYSVGLIGEHPPVFKTIGIVVYKSTNGGRSWGNPRLIHKSPYDDKQWVAADANPLSPFRGRVYAVWDDYDPQAQATQLRFARTLDRGATWEGTAGQPAGVSVAISNFSPEINVANDGTIYIVWIAGARIEMIVSSDGGDSFSRSRSWPT